MAARISHGFINRNITFTVYSLIRLIHGFITGDMTSLTWIQSFFSRDSVRVEFSALNFRDPMVASRRLNITTLPYDGQISNLRKILKGFLMDDI